MSDKLLMPSTITADCKVVYRIGPEQTLAGLNTTTDYALHIRATSGLKKIISSVEAASSIHLAFPCPNQQKPVKNTNLTKRKEGDH